MCLEVEVTPLSGSMYFPNLWLRFLLGYPSSRLEDTPVLAGEGTPVQGVGGEVSQSQLGSTPTPAGEAMNRICGGQYASSFFTQEDFLVS